MSILVKNKLELTMISILLDKVHSLNTDQMRYFMNIALQWILKNKDENIYLTDSG